MNSSAHESPHRPIRDASFGIVPVRYRSQQWQVLLVQHRQGHWAFPKGHPDGEESHPETACRELFEETRCLVLRILDYPDLVETYQFRAAHRVVSKTVTYFLAEAEGDPIPQPEELKAAAWLSLREADHKVTFEKCRRMIQEVSQFLEGRTPDQLTGRPELVVRSCQAPS